MITDEHFETLRKVREETKSLRLACIVATGTPSLIHMAFDHGTAVKPMPIETAALGKLRLIK